MALSDPNAPAWLMDLQGSPTGDPLLDQLEEERRRRLALSSAQSQPTAPIPTAPTAAPITAPSGLPAPMPSASDQSPPDPTLEQRNAEAQLNMARAKVADEEADTPSSGLRSVPTANFEGVAKPSQTTPTVDSWDAQVYAAAQATGTPVNVIKGIMDIESKGDPGALSGAGAVGLMQVMPFNAQNGEDLSDPATNIMRGAAMLAERYQRYGSWEKAAASYFGALDGNGNITSASDGNTDGYGYVDAFTAKAHAYAQQQEQQAPQYGPSLPGFNRAMAAGNVRPSQSPEANPDLSISEAYADCGPAAAIVFAAMTGRAPTLHEAQDMASSIKAWSAGVGMYGPDAEVRLIRALGGDAELRPGLDEQTIQQELVNGNPVIVDSPGHYGVISGFDPASGRYYFGSSATDLKGGQEWMTLDEYQALRATGPIRGMLLAENPLGSGPSAAVGSEAALPRNFHPDDPIAPTEQNNPDLAASRAEMEHAQELARVVTEQVRQQQEKAKQESQTARVQPPQQQPLAFPQPPEANPSTDMSLLKQPLSDQSSSRTDQQTAEQQPEQPGLLQQIGQHLPSIQDVTDFAGRQTRHQLQLPEDVDNPPQPVQQTGVLGWLQTFSNNAANATVGIVGSLDSYAEGALSAAGFGDTQATQFFHNSADYFDRLQQQDPRFKQDELDLWKPSTYADPKTYAVIAGQLLPSVLGAIATGGLAGALLGETAAAAPLVSRLPMLGTLAEALGSALFTLPTSAGSTYADLKKLGASDKEAFIGANISGALQSALEVVNPTEGVGALKHLFGEADASRPFKQRLLGAARELATGFLKEGSEEANQQLVDNVVQKWFGSDKSWFDQVPQNFIVGGLGSLGMGVPGALGTVRGRPQAHDVQGFAGDLAAELERRGVVAAGPSQFETGSRGLSQTETPLSQTETPLSQTETTLPDTTTRDNHQILPPTPASGGAAAPQGDRILPSEGMAQSGPVTPEGSRGSENPPPPTPSRFAAASAAPAAPVRSFSEVDQALEQGRPVSPEELDAHYITMRHGASADYGATSFRPEMGQSSSNLAFGRGYYLTDNPAVSNMYTAGGDDSVSFHRDLADAEARGDTAAAAEARRRIEAQAGQGGHSRVVLVPRSLNLLDAADTLAPSEMARIQGIAVRVLQAESGSDFARRIQNLEQQASPALRGLRRQMTPAAFEQYLRGKSPWSFTDVGQERDQGLREQRKQQVLDALAAPIPNHVQTVTDFYMWLSGKIPGLAGNTFANTILEQAGYDGIRFTDQTVPIAGYRHNSMVVFPGSQDKVRNAFSGERGGMTTAVTVPNRTARVGPFEAPGLDQGTYARAEGGAWTDINTEQHGAVPGQPDVKAVSRDSTPPDLVQRVAARPYVQAFISSARDILERGAGGARSAMQIVQALAGTEAPRFAGRVGHVLVGVQDTLGWTDNRDHVVGINPAEIYHGAVVSVAAEERRNGPFTDQQRRDKLVHAMARKQVEVVLHEAVHHWGDAQESANHGPAFKELERPLDALWAIYDAGKNPTGIQLEEIRRLYGVQGRDANRIFTELRQLVRATERTLAATFGTLQGQDDQLAQLNADAREQRLLNFTPAPGSENATTDQLARGGDQHPVDLHERGGPAVSPGESPEGPVEPGAGAGEPGLRDGARDVSPGAQPEGAAGLGSPGPERDAGSDAAGPEPAVGEPDRGRVAGPEPAALFTPGPNAGAVDARLGGGLDALRQAIIAQHEDNAPGRVAEQLLATYGEQLRSVKGTDLLGALGFPSDSPVGRFARDVVVTTQAAMRMEREIDARPNPKDGWGIPEVLKLLGPAWDIRNPSHVRVADSVIQILKARGVLTDNNFRARQTQATPPAEALGAAAAPNTRSTTPGPESTSEAAPAPSASSERAVPNPVARAIADIRDDDFVRRKARGGNGGGREYGAALAQDLVVDGNRTQTEANRRNVLKTIDARRDALKAEREGLETELSTLTDGVDEAERDTARIAEIQARLSDIVTLRDNLAAIKGGLGWSARSEEQAGPVTETMAGRDGKPEQVRISRWVIPTNGGLQAVVRGIGNMAMQQPEQVLTGRRSAQNPMGVNAESQAALNVLADAVSRLPRSRFEDQNGDLIGMTEMVSRAVEIFYGGEKVSVERFMADIEHLAREIRRQQPNMDVEQPQLLATLLQGFQMMTHDAMTKVREAAAQDRAVGTDRQVVRGEDGRPLIDPITGQQVRGPARYEALKAMQDLMSMSSLLPSIKKIATTSGRNLRVMQMAEERLQAQSHIEVLQGLQRTAVAYADLFRKAQAQIEADPELLGKFAMLRPDSTPEQIRRVLGNVPIADMLIEMSQRGVGLPQLLDQYAGLAGKFTNLSDLINNLGGVEELGERKILTQQQAREITRKLEREREWTEAGHDDRLYDDAELKAISEQVLNGMGSVNERLRRSAKGPDGLSYQQRIKRLWRSNDRENVAMEMVDKKIRNLSKQEQQRFLDELDEGLDPRNVDLERFWNESARPGARYTRAELKASLLAKRAEILAWQRENDPDSRAYQQSHRFGLASAGPARSIASIQKDLGEAYKSEIIAENALPFFRQSIEEATTPEERERAQALYDLHEAESAAAQRDIAALHAEVGSLLFDQLSDRLDIADTKRDLAEQKLDQAGIDALVAQVLGLRAMERADRDAFRQAVANRNIGVVDAEVRRLLDDHFHSAYDERLEAEGWVRLVSDVEREYGSDPRPKFQAKVQEIRDRAYSAIAELEQHTAEGEPMARALLSRMAKAIHGDAGTLVAGIQQALTREGYLVEGERHADYGDAKHPGDVQAIGDRALISELAGTDLNPGPLARTLEDPFDAQARKDLDTQLDHVAGVLAPHGLGTAFKDAVLAAVNIAHQRAAVLDLLPLVEANPTDPAIRYVVQSQLAQLKQDLANRETEPWFRRRYGTVEQSLRARYEEAIAKGAARLDLRAERAAEAANTYDVLVDVGLAANEDRLRSVRGEPSKKSATELIVERLERQRAEALRQQIVRVTQEYWAEPDFRRRTDLQAMQENMLGALERIGRYHDLTTGEEKGVGLEVAKKLKDQIFAKSFKEETKQGVRQQGYSQRAEITALTREIRLVHRNLSLVEEGSPEHQQLRAEIADLFRELRSVGATEDDPSLKDQGVSVAKQLEDRLHLRDLRDEESDADRVERRRAVLEVRDLRQQAMAQARALADDPQNPVARAEFTELVRRMAEVTYPTHGDVEVTERDAQGGITSRRTERQRTTVLYGAQQADRLQAMVDIRIGSSLQALELVSQQDGLDRPTEQAIIRSAHENLVKLVTSARSSDDAGRVGAEIGRLIGMMENLGTFGKQQADKERARLRQVGFSRAMLSGDETARNQAATFFAMIAPTETVVTDPRTGQPLLNPDGSVQTRMEYSPRSVGRALRLVTAPNWADYYREYGIVAMLSSPTTWGWLGANTIGQVLNAAIQPTRWAYRLGADAARAKLSGGPRTVFASEAKAALGAVDWALLKRAGKASFETWWYGHSTESLQKADETGDLRGIRPELLVDMWPDTGVGRIMRTLSIGAHMGSLRLMKALDEFVGTVVYEAAYQGQLERMRQQTGKTVPQIQDDIHLLSEVVKRSGKIRQNVLFQEHDALLNWINKVARPSGIARRDSKWAGPLQALDIVMTTYLPFTTVPYNALKQSAELSGLGAIAHTALAAHHISTHKGGLAGATARALSEVGHTSQAVARFDADNTFGRTRQTAEASQLTDHLAKAALGATIQGIALLLAGLGLLSGDEPEDTDKRGIDQEERLPPRSVKIGSRWYSYDNTPFAVPFALAGNMLNRWPDAWAAQEAKSAGSASKAGAMTWAAGTGAVSAVFHNFFLENMLEAASGVTGIGAPRSEASVVYGLGAPIITRNVSPALLAYLARQGDDFERDTRSDDPLGRLGNLFMSRMPVLRDRLPAKVGILGEDVANTQPFGAGLISYSRSERAQFDQIFRILGKYGADTNLVAPKTLAVPGLPSGQFETTGDEQRAWQRAFGARLKTEVAKTYNSPDFGSINGVAPGQDRATALQNLQQKRMQDAVNRARSLADTEVLRGIEPVPARRGLVLAPRIDAYRRKHAVLPSQAPEH